MECAALYINHSSLFFLGVLGVLGGSIFFFFLMKLCLKMECAVLYINHSPRWLNYLG